jgi:hypothetical protein
MSQYDYHILALSSKPFRSCRPSHPLFLHFARLSKAGLPHQARESSRDSKVAFCLSRINPEAADHQMACNTVPSPSPLSVSLRMALPSDLLQHTVRQMLELFLNPNSYCMREKCRSVPVRSIYKMLQLTPRQTYRFSRVT